MTNQNMYFNRHFLSKKLEKKKSRKMGLFTCANHLSLSENDHSPKQSFPITAILSPPDILFLTCPILPSKANQSCLTFPDHWMIPGVKREPRWEREGRGDLDVLGLERFRGSISNDHWEGRLQDIYNALDKVGTRMSTVALAVLQVRGQDNIEAIFLKIPD